MLYLLIKSTDTPAVLVIRISHCVTLGLSAYPLYMVVNEWIDNLCVSYTL